MSAIQIYFFPLLVVTLTENALITVTIKEIECFLKKIQTAKSECNFENKAVVMTCCPAPVPPSLHLLPSRLGWHKDMLWPPYTRSTCRPSESTLAKAGQHKWWEGVFLVGGDWTGRWIGFRLGPDSTGKTLTPTSSPFSLSRTAQICSREFTIHRGGWHSLRIKGEKIPLPHYSPASTYRALDKVQATWPACLSANWDCSVSQKCSK